MNSKQNALEIRGLYFHYKSDKQILNGINLTVPKGGIYGLLGSSGCGKTTLLRCSLGRLKPKSGSITLLGNPPGSKESRVPGPGVGYMPQELALYDDFTIEETLLYFGRLFGIKSNVVDQRIDFLVDLLQLPERQRLVSKLSGGQKRRVSIGTALLHNPPLLILDEPTVGVDLILRDAIWKHLELLCANGLTVIVTTHYIEETKTALRVGFMRSGSLLAEESPQELLRMYSLNTLEAVFLKLSQMDEQRIADKNSLNDLMEINEEVIEDFNQNNKTGIILKVFKSKDNEYLNTGNNSSNHLNGAINKTKIDISMRRYSRKQSIANGLIQLRQETIITETNSGLRLFALCLKNFKQMSRNWLLLLFFVILPGFEITLFLTCIGKDIKHIPIGVFNPEKSAVGSELFLKSIDENQINLIRYNTLESAIDAVKHNDVWAVIYFKSNFTRYFFERLIGLQTNNKTIDFGSIHLRIDMSNPVIATQIQKYISEAFDTFVNHLAKEYGKEELKPMIKIEQPLYGGKNAPFSSFVAPGTLIVMAYFATTTMTTHLLIKERTDGLVERSLVAGVKPLEFVLSHIILQLFLLTLQVSLILIVSFIIFCVPNKGSIFCASSLIYLQGICGLMFGLMLSALCPDEIYATTICIGAFFPTVIIGGVFWPLESLPTGLKYVSQVMPSSLAIDSLRSILMRGWGLDYFKVFIGFLTTVLWLLLFMTNAFIFFIKKL